MRPGDLFGWLERVDLVEEILANLEALLAESDSSRLSERTEDIIQRCRRADRLTGDGEQKD